MISNSPVNILLVDHEPKNLLVLEAVLGPLGEKLIRANSGQEALRQVLEIDFAAIILDARMPTMDGFETAKLIRSHPRSQATPIIFLTASGSSDQSMVEAYALGAVDYLTQPVIPAVLQAKVRFFVELHRTKEELRAADRRAAEAAFRQQKELWQTTLSSIGDAVIATDTERRVTFLNAEAERLTGWKRAQAVGRDLDEVFPIVNEDTRQLVPCPVRKVLDTGVVVGLANHTVLVSRDGTERPINDSAAPIRDESGVLYGVVLVFRDITEKYNTDKKLLQARDELESRVIERTAELQREKSFLQAVLENIEDSIVACDEQGLLTLFNRATKNLHGLPQEPLPPEEWARHYALFGPDGETPLSKDEVPLFRALAGEFVKDAEMVIAPTGGEPRTLLASGQPLHDADGHKLGAVVSMHDITDRKKAAEALTEVVREQGLRRSEQQVRDVLESISDGFVLLESEWRISYMNAAAERINGQRREDYLGKNHWEAYPATVGTVVHRELLRCAAEHVPVSFENYYEPWDRWFEVDASPALGGSIAIYYRDVTERKRAGEALRQSEARNRAVVETALDCIIGMDQDGRITEFNPAAEKTFGYRKAEVLGRELAATIIPLEFRDRHREGMREYLSTGVAQVLDRRLELQAIRKSGERFDCELTVTRNPGEPPSFTGFLRDVTEIKLAAEALKGSEQRFRLLADTIPNLAWMARPDGHIFWYNRRWYDYTGTTPEAMEGWGWQNVHHPEELPKVLERWSQSITTGEPFNMVFPLKGADGVFRPFLTLVNPFREPTGEILFWFGTNTDISEQKRDEERLTRLAEIERHRSGLLTQIAEASRSINAVLSVDSITRVLSEEARRILGTHVAVISLSPRDDYDQAVRAVSLSEKYARDRGDGQPDGFAAYVCQTNLPLRLTETEIEAHPEWGGIPDFSNRGWLGMPLIGHGGKNLGLIQLSDKEEGEFTSEDEAVLGQLAATASVGLENARLYDSLREQDKRKDEFLATLAHELRNPLAPVRTGLEILKVAGNDERALIARDMMERQLGHMVRMVDDLMDVSRVSRGQMELRPQRSTLRTIFDMALETSLPLIEAGRHQLSVSLPEEPLHVRADLTRLAQMLSNLINNAAKYTPEGGRIDLSGDLDGAEVVIKVTDTGVGIPGEMLSKVFDLFTQVGRTLDRSQGGLGIGLSLVRRLVEMHGGTVRAESPGLGLGSTFTVRLPHAAAESDEPEISGISPEGKATRPLRRVLVVDDNVDGAESLAMLLQLSGHETRTVHTGPDALTAASEFRPDVVFLDIGLPGMNGYEVAKRLRLEVELNETVIVALTGWGSEDDRKRAREAGFDGHLTKPVDPAAVREILGSFTGRI